MKFWQIAGYWIVAILIVLLIWSYAKRKEKGK